MVVLKFSSLRWLLKIIVFGSAEMHPVKCSAVYASNITRHTAFDASFESNGLSFANMFAVQNWALVWRRS